MTDQNARARSRTEHYEIYRSVPSISKIGTRAGIPNRFMNIVAEYLALVGIWFSLPSTPWQRQVWNRRINEGDENTNTNTEPETPHIGRVERPTAL